MTVLITLTTAGADTGPFNLFSDANGYTSAFALGVSKLDLEAGYPSNVVPDETTTIKVQSVNSLCNNFILLPTGIVTTTTTTTANTSCSTCVIGDVVIGTQTWTGCNLDITTYRNGDIIPQVTDPTEWASLTTGAWCYYENDPLNCITYGKLYNWFAVNDPRGLAPIGYHIPTDTEYTTLITYLSGTSVAGGKMKEIGTTHWYTPNTGATNESNLTVLPGGWRTNFGGFNNIQNNGVLWSSTEVSTTGGKVCFLAANSSAANIYSYDQVFGFSIRLIKD